MKTVDQTRFYREQDAFVERHLKTADLLVFDTRTHVCTEAIYYSPIKKAEDAMKTSLHPIIRAMAEGA